MRLRLSNPSLVVLVGAAGAGKSTLAARHFPADAVLSSDALRGVVAGDETDQRATRTAFSILHRALARRLATGRLTVVDATNVTADARRSLVRRAAAAGVPAIAIVLDLDPTLVATRNALRPGRIVPSDAVQRQQRELATSLRRGLDGEGFAAVHVLRDPSDVDDLEIDWDGRATPPR
ncbi:MAG TPA: AAA family ATPase [Candidatus Binatia bacterium]|nr:AAA family ATPase [Candidatus Binatia bacterium]